MSKNWSVEYIKEAENDLKSLDGSVRPVVVKAIQKVSSNPLPQNEGGYGKPLGSVKTNNLSGLLKVKLKKHGIRVIYSLIREKETMRIIIIGIRSDNEVYFEVKKRI